METTLSKHSSEYSGHLLRTRQQLAKKSWDLRFNNAPRVLITTISMDANVVVDKHFNTTIIDLG